MSESENHIISKLKSYRRKYYFNLAIRGLFIAIGLTLSIFLIINVLEYSFRFGSLVRAFLLFSFIAAGLYALGRYVVLPLYKLSSSKHGMTDEEAARRIGKAFPEISDKLLNIIQLKNLKGELAEASIQQKAITLQRYEFADAVDVKGNRRYLKYMIAAEIPRPLKRRLS